MATDKTPSRGDSRAGTLKLPVGAGGAKSGGSVGREPPRKASPPELSYLPVLVTVPDTKVVWVLLAARHMPPILFNRSVLFPNRSITRCLEHAGDRQIFEFTVFGAAGST